MTHKPNQKPKHDPMDLSDLGIDDVLDASGLDDPRRTGSRGASRDPFANLDGLELDERAPSVEFPAPGGIAAKIARQRARLAIVDADADAYGDTEAGEALQAAANEAVARSKAGRTALEFDHDMPAWASDTLAQPAQELSADSGDAPTLLIDRPDLADIRRTNPGGPARPPASSRPGDAVSRASADSAAQSGSFEAAGRRRQAAPVQGSEAGDRRVDADAIADMLLGSMARRGYSPPDGGSAMPSGRDEPNAHPPLSESGAPLSLAPPAARPSPSLHRLAMPGAPDTREVAAQPGSPFETPTDALDLELDLDLDSSPSIDAPRYVAPPTHADGEPGAPLANSTALLDDLPEGVVARARREATPKTDPSKRKRVTHDPDRQVLARARVEARAFGHLVEERNSAAERDQKRDLENMLAEYVAEPLPPEPMVGAGIVRRRVKKQS